MQTTITNKHIARYVTHHENPIEVALTEALGYPVECSPCCIYRKNPYVKMPKHQELVGVFITPKQNTFFNVLFGDVRKIKPGPIVFSLV